MRKSTADTGAAVRTTQRSIDVLTVVRERNGARLGEVADAAGMAKSTAYKHLRTLARNGFLRKEGETYEIGLRLLGFGEHVRLNWPGFDQITEAVSELTDRTREEVDFLVEQQGRVTTLVESYHPWVKYDDGTRTAGTYPGSGSGSGSGSDRYQARIGDDYHMHSTAGGLAILAEYSDDRVEEIVDRWGLPRRTDHTITSRDALFETLRTVRERGYAINDQGYVHGMRSLAKAVVAPDGSVVGALCVAGPAYRLDGSVLEERLPAALKDVVDSLESNLAATRAD
jgi:DNA-binding IclR family transcriptional regulator